MVKLRVHESWKIVPLWQRLSKRFVVDYYAVINKSLYEGEHPGGALWHISGPAWWDKHRYERRIYILVGKRPDLHLLVVSENDIDQVMEEVKWVI